MITKWINYQTDAKIIEQIRENLSKNSDRFELLQEQSPNFSLQDIVQHITKQSTVIINALKREFLFYVVCVISHCHYSTN